MRTIKPSMIQSTRIIVMLLLSVCAGAILTTGCSKKVVKEIPKPIVRDTAKPKSQFDTTFDAKGITPKGEIRDTLIVTKHKVQATEYHALLPYIFFDQDSAAIPARYVRVEKKNRKKYNFARIKRGDPIEAYHHILNIIGQRMRENGKFSITVTGCHSQLENGDTSLTRRRAEAVKNYIVDVWRISPRRITVVAGGLPQVPSLSEVDEKLSAQENQRVEILPNNDSLLAPVALPDTATLQPVGTVRFFPPQSDDTVNMPDTWSMNIAIGDSVVRDAVTGSGPPPARIDFPLDDIPNLQGKSSLPISSTIVLRDTGDKELGKAPSRKVFVREIGIYEEQYPVVNNQYVHRYNLLLFAFDSSSAMQFSRQAADLIKNKITPNSNVRIVGHTDKIGLPYYNKKLSIQRAQFAQELLGTQGNVTGVGESESLYDQDLPEGRYYSRTVTITVMSPVGQNEVFEPSPAPEKETAKKNRTKKKEEQPSQ